MLFAYERPLCARSGHSVHLRVGEAAGVVQSSSASNSTDGVTSAFEEMGASQDADPNHGRTFILCVGAIGRPEPRVRLS
jgi:hypothetical protein